jgi:hypothetical protein
MGGGRFTGGPEGGGMVAAGAACCLLRLVHGDAEVGRQAFESAVVALADGPELPGALAAVELAEHEGGLDRRARAVEAGDHGVLSGVPDLDVQVGDLAERPAVGGGGEDDAVDGGLHAREVDEQGVGQPSAGVALALVADRAGGVRGLVVEHEVAVGADLPVDQQQGRGVRVGTPGPDRQPNSTRSAVVGTGTFDPFGIDMSAPITCHRARTRPGSPSGVYPHNLFPGAANAHEGRGNTVGQPAGNPPGTRLYPIRTRIDALFCQVRSHWGSHATADTENNPLIGLPNQHIVGLTYVP